MIDPNHNLLIGYLLLDKDDHVLCPRGSFLIQYFTRNSGQWKQRPNTAAKVTFTKWGRYGLKELSVLFFTTTAILMFDGSTAECFVEALRVRGMLPDRKATRRIDPTITEPKYSCRVLFGDIRYNRNIAVSQHSETSEENRIR